MSLHAAAGNHISIRRLRQEERWKTEKIACKSLLSGHSITVHRETCQVLRPILVSASADPFAPKARSIDGAWTNVVRSFRSPAACPPGLDGIVHTGCIAANGLAVAVADELSSRSSPCSSIKLLVFRT